MRHAAGRPCGAAVAGGGCVGAAGGVLEASVASALGVAREERAMGDERSMMEEIVVE